MYHNTGFRVMNTDVSVLLWSTDKDVSAAFATVRNFFYRMHNLFTRFDKNSELSALNKSGGVPFSASVELFDVVEKALKPNVYSVDDEKKTA